MNFSGKHVLVTGGSRGLGLDLVRSFLEAGATVTSCALEPEPGAELAAVVKLLGPDRFAYVGCDLSDPASAARVTSAGQSRFGPIHVLVNNAASVAFKPIDEVSVGDFDRMIAINLRSVWLFSIEAARDMTRNQGGAIVNIGSTHGYATRQAQFPYNVSKAGVSALTKALAVEFGEKNVRVNAVLPGIIQARNYASWIRGSKHPAELEQRVIESHCLDRLPSLAEVSNAVLFLASDLATGITGIELFVDCGRQVKRFG